MNCGGPVVITRGGQISGLLGAIWIRLARKNSWLWQRASFALICNSTPTLKDRQFFDDSRGGRFLPGHDRNWPKAADFGVQQVGGYLGYTGRDANVAANLCRRRRRCVGSGAGGRPNSGRAAWITSRGDLGMQLVDRQGTAGPVPQTATSRSF